MRTALLVVQVATFVILGVMLCAQGQWKLGAAQLLLAGVQGIIYS
jgi:hypothetical protein